MFEVKSLVSSKPTYLEHYTRLYLLTDEDSGEEDGGGTLDNFSSPQLQAEAEVHVKMGQGESLRVRSSLR